MKRTLCRGSILFAIVAVSLGIVFFSIDLHSQEAFGVVENFVILQTGIISTQDRDFAVSNDFETRIFKNGNIMRLSGITTTGEPYYIYQKNIGDDIILKGKILVTRETPLTAINLENMLKLARLGVVILPPVPGFYTKPKTIDELVDHTVGKCLDQFDIDHDLYKRWGE